MNFLNGLMDNSNAYTQFPWLKNLVNVLNSVVAPILIVIGAVGIIYAIYLGVMLAKAENAEKREEAKKRIINVIVAIVITAALIFLMYLFSNNLDWFIGKAQSDAGLPADSNGDGKISQAEADAWNATHPGDQISPTARIGLLLAFRVARMLF